MSLPSSGLIIMFGLLFWLYFGFWCIVVNPNLQSQSQDGFSYSYLPSYSYLQYNCHRLKGYFGIYFNNVSYDANMAWKSTDTRWKISLRWTGVTRELPLRLSLRTGFSEPGNGVSFYWIYCAKYKLSIHKRYYIF